MLQPVKNKLKPRAIDSAVVQKDGIASKNLDIEKDRFLDQLNKETTDKKELVSTGYIKKPKSLYFQQRPKNNNAMLSQENRSKEESNMAAEKARKASESKNLNALPLIYLNNPTKAIGDVLSAAGANKSMNFETSEKDRQELAYNTQNPYKSGNEKLKYSLKKGAELVPGAAINLAVAGEGSGVQGALKSFNNVVNPFAGTGILSRRVMPPPAGGLEAEKKANQKIRFFLNEKKYQANELVNKIKKIPNKAKKGEYGLKNLYYNKLEADLKGDIKRTSMFDKNPREAISYANSRLSALSPGRRINEKSLSSDSFPLSVKILEKNKNDFNIIDTGSFNPINDYGRKYKARMFSKDPEFTGNATEYATNKTLEEFNQKISELSAATGKKINNAKIIDGVIHVPNIIAERKGGGVVSRALRLKKPLEFSAAVGGGVAATKALINSNERVKKLERKRDSIQYEMQNSSEKRKLDSIIAISDREDSIGEIEWKKEQEAKKALKQRNNKK